MPNYHFLNTEGVTSGEVEATSNMVENSHIPNGKKNWKSLLYC